ncbi:MAG: siphovirus Gp157 family protein [Clostridia bacterium]|nr:siphovirus Gp157 family protein [Clostridia bacterium]
MKLYEIADEYQRMLAVMEEYEMPEDVIQNTLECIQDDADQKIDNIVSMIKDLTGDIEALKKESAALAERAKSKQNNINWLKGYLANYLPKVGYEKKAFENEHHKLSFRMSKATQITDPAAFLKWAQENAPDLLKYKDPEPDKTAIKTAINDGREIAFAEIVENRNLQIK